MIKSLSTRIVAALLLLALSVPCAFAAGTKISELTSGAPIQDSDAFPLQRSTSNYKATGTDIAAYVRSELDLPIGAVAFSGYISTRGYLVGPPAAGVSSTNTNTLTSDTMYGIVGPIHKTTTITGMSLRTSTSNASVGASAKFCIYALQADGTPGALQGATSPAVSIGDSATSTNYSATFSSPILLSSGTYLFVVLPTATTTGANLAIYSAASFWSTYNGGSSASNVLSGSPILGYTGSATYSSGCPSSFGTPTAITATSTSSANHAPVLAFTVQ